jgi:hypothetical protein
MDPMEQPRLAARTRRAKHNELNPMTVVNYRLGNGFRVRGLKRDVVRSDAGPVGPAACSGHARHGRFHSASSHVSSVTRKATAAITGTVSIMTMPKFSIASPYLTC